MIRPPRPIVQGIPDFGLIKWNVKALLPFSTAAQAFPGYLQDARQQMQGGGKGG